MSFFCPITRVFCEQTKPSHFLQLLGLFFRVLFTGRATSNQCHAGEDFFFGNPEWLGFDSRSRTFFACDCDEMRVPVLLVLVVLYLVEKQDTWSLVAAPL